MGSIKPRNEGSIPSHRGFFYTIMEYKIQRKFTRWDLNHEVALKLAGAQVTTSCRVHNISFKGIEFALDQQLEADKPNKLQLFFSDGASISLEAWVMWHRAVDGLNVYGLYFTRISDADKERLYEFVVRYCREQVRDNMYRDIVGGPQDSQVIPDRRDFERFPMSLPLVYADPVTQKKSLTRTSDMSATGLGLVANEPLKPSTALDLEIRLIDQAQFICMKARVVWSMAHEQDQYRAGLKFERAQFMEMGRLLRTSPAA